MYTFFTTLLDGRIVMGNKKYTVVWFSVIDGWTMGVDLFDSKEEAQTFMERDVEQIIDEYKRNVPESNPYVFDNVGQATVLCADGVNQYSWSIETVTEHHNDSRDLQRWDFLEEMHNR